MPLSPNFLRLQNTLTCQIGSRVGTVRQIGVGSTYLPYIGSSSTFHTGSDRRYDRTCLPFSQHGNNGIRSEARDQEHISTSTHSASNQVEELRTPRSTVGGIHNGSFTTISGTAQVGDGMPASCHGKRIHLKTLPPSVSCVSANGSSDAASDDVSIEHLPKFRKVFLSPLAGSPTKHAVGSKNVRIKHNRGSRSKSLSRLPRKHLQDNPTWLLSQWLDKESSAEDDKWEAICSHVSTPQIILLRHMYRGRLHKGTTHNPTECLDKEAAAILSRQGFKKVDVESWAWVLSGKNSDVRAERYLSLERPKPSFLLAVILRKPLSQVHTLRAILLDVWDQVRQASAHALPGEAEDLPGNPSKGSVHQAGSGDIGSYDHRFFFTEASFDALLKQLLNQARQLWPPATVSLAQMFKAYYLQRLPGETTDATRFHRQRHVLLCRRYNEIICALASPASLNPMKSMTYNWMAQRVILEMGGQLDPRLILSSHSYRAMIRVLAASKKSDQESEITTLRRREWPPWTVERSGMDARKSLEEDFSRVVLAGSTMREAGYAEDASDVAMKILGGQEIDGTPTVLTRTLVRAQATHTEPASDVKLDPEIWAARIRATRDVQEAWSAFTAFEGAGGKAHWRVYLAMFEKLNSDGALQGRRKVQNDVTPGDAKEVLPPLRDNITAYYQSRLQPPSLDVLYTRMIGKGVRPVGPCLVFLVRHAAILREGLRYLRDGKEDESVIGYLTGSSKLVPSDIVEKIPHALYTAFIELLCRCAPRAQVVTSDLDARNKKTLVAGNGVSVSTGSDTRTPSLEAVTRWEIRQLPLPEGLRNFDPLQHAIYLLNQRQCRKQAWHAVFQTVARQGAVVDRTKVGEAENDILSWEVLRSLWRDHKTSIGELDPEGFRIICHGFEKAMLAILNGADHNRTHINDAFSDIKNDFRRLCDTANTESPEHHLPALLHQIDGVHLHIYVRVAGLLEDYAELLFVLRWMLRNHEALYDRVFQARNGRRLLRRAIVAAKVFVSGTEYEAEARTLVENVESWGGWPDEDEMNTYINY